MDASWGSRKSKERFIFLGKLNQKVVRNYTPHIPSFTSLGEV